VRPLKLIIVAGARPNFMKIKPILKEIDRIHSFGSPSSISIRAILVHTGQHYDENMSDIFFRELEIRQPDLNLEVGSASHGVQTANIMIKFEAVCDQERPDWVVVVGDINSTLACALVCAKMGIRVVHIEAGLRSFDRKMPEEINRIVTDALAELLLTPSEDANENLRREGISEDKIKFVGNIMIDSLVENLPKARLSGILSRLCLDRGRFAFVTLHRPENVDVRENLSAIMASMEELSKRMPVVFPIHPRTHKMLREFGLMSPLNDRLLLLEPIGYHASLSLTENARLVLTDSGGLQEEATFFRTPCLTLRSNTERPITIILGSNKLTTRERLLNDAYEAFDGPEHRGQVPPLWDGRTAERVMGCILEASSI